MQLHIFNSYHHGVDNYVSHAVLIKKWLNYCKILELKHFLTLSWKRGCDLYSVPTIFWTFLWQKIGSDLYSGATYTRAFTVGVKLLDYLLVQCQLIMQSCNHAQFYLWTHGGVKKNITELMLFFYKLTEGTTHPTVKISNCKCFSTKTWGTHPLIQVMLNFSIKSQWTHTLFKP